MTRSRIRACERGMTLIEVSVAMVLMVAVLPVLGVMVSSMRTGAELQARSEMLDELRIQGAAIARELRSAECIYEPTIADGDHSAASSRLRFTTNANGAVYEVVYEVVDGELIRTRDGTQRIVGRGLENSSDAFTHNATPRRTVDVRFVVRVDPAEEPVVLDTTVAGRNAWLSLSC